MKSIIGGLIYDTENAEKVCRLDVFGTLYKKNSTWFIYMFCLVGTIIPVHEDQVKIYLQDKPEIYLKYFEAKEI